ncbi:MAG: hypothetical protein PHS95_00835 [Candidatus Pacebacteria bacterium]|nr:hypothetical protein [Candidatus Paceibacterota bacterium]
MLRLTELLGRFSRLTNTEKAKKELIGAEIAKIVGVSVEPENISFSKNTIFLNVPPVVRTEILLKKQEILEKIKLIPVLCGVVDIR